MTQKGNHTWDLAIHYHLCPECKRIVESRRDIKKIECPFCRHAWTLTGSQVLESAEWDWD